MKTSFLTIAFALLVSLQAFAQKPADKQKVTFKIVESEVQKPFFRVTGTERFWRLEMSGKHFKFLSINENESFEVPYKAPKLSEDGKSKSYIAHSDKHDMKIDIFQEKCSDGMTDSTYTHVVRLSIKKTSDDEFTVLKGCGNFIPDARLNTVWVLEQLNGKKVSKYDFGSELPYLDIHVNEAAVTGFGGCNRLKTSLVMEEHNLLRFLEIIATKMACLSNNKESQFMDALKKITRYEIGGGKLILSDGKGVKAVFVKGV